MEEKLSPYVEDYCLATRFLEDNVVEHSHDDPEAPPGSPLRRERWVSGGLLGRGGQGQVFLQRCTTQGRTSVCRAVKKIPLHRDEKVQRYIRELETMVRFSHQKVYIQP